MLTDIHERLMRAKERLRQKQKLEAVLHEAQGILHQAQKNWLSETEQKGEQIAAERHQFIEKA